MADRNNAFGIYENAQDAEATVNELLTVGFDASAIRVLHPDNQASRDFAQRKGTRLPAGINDSATADLPLDGSWGILNPGEGPVQGALPLALADMGIPAEWADGSTRDGKLLLSVECVPEDSVPFATAILTSTKATETGTSALEENGVLVASPRTSL